ncbi:MAG: Hsp20/alpha crystallin family protein [Patescibacteria group bacterium UBA2103]
MFGKKKKQSLFEKLTGSVSLSEDYDAFEDDFKPEAPEETPVAPRKMMVNEHDEPLPPELEEELEEEEGSGQLPVDVYQSPNEIVIRAFVAGVRSDMLDISITRDMVTISGAREVREEVDNSDYFHKELYWGSFSRTILLPQEVDVDGSSASAKDGLLTLILPKLDKARQTKLKVKNG